jgi:hypothetical protein
MVRALIRGPVPQTFMPRFLQAVGIPAIRKLAVQFLCPFGFPVRMSVRIIEARIVSTVSKYRVVTLEDVRQLIVEAASRFAMRAARATRAVLLRSRADTRTSACRSFRRITHRHRCGDSCGGSSAATWAQHQVFSNNGSSCAGKSATWSCRRGRCSTSSPTQQQIWKGLSGDQERPVRHRREARRRA